MVPGCSCRRSRHRCLRCRRSEWWAAPGSVPIGVVLGNQEVVVVWVMRIAERRTAIGGFVVGAVFAAEVFGTDLMD